jgi:hypothetical protein
MLPAGRARSSVLLVLIGVAMLLVSGCATTRRVPDSTAVAGGADRVPESLPAGDRAFIEESLSLLASRAAQAAQAPQAAAPRDAESPPEPPGPLSAAPGEPSPTNQRPSGIGGRFSVERVVGFVSFSNWEMGRELLRETGILADAGVDRLGRVVFVTERDRAMLFLDVDSRRLPVAWSLLRSPWKRVSRGQWRDPATGATLELRRNASWIYSRGGVPLATGAGDGATDVTVGSTRPPIIGATAWETLDLLHRRSVDVPSRVPFAPSSGPTASKYRVFRRGLYRRRRPLRSLTAPRRKGVGRSRSLRSVKARPRRRGDWTMVHSWRRSRSLSTTNAPLGPPRLPRDSLSPRFSRGRGWKSMRVLVSYGRVR